MKLGTPGFVGQRLVEARESRAISASALAEIVGVTSAAISQYENGKQTPAPGVMRLICATLNVPFQRFLAPVTTRDKGTIFYRSLSSATKKARSRAEVRYGWLTEIVLELEKYVTLPQPVFPKALEISDPAILSVEAIENAAISLRHDWNLDDGPINNLCWLLESKGAIISVFDLEAEALSAFSEWHGSDNRPFFILNSREDLAPRLRFNLAHELGHMVLHRSMPKATYFKTEYFKLMELQAHRFASAFLFPATSFVEEFTSCSLSDLFALKHRWRMSLASIIHRASDLKLITEHQEQVLWMKIARNKWRKSEPYDDQIPDDKPCLLSNCVNALIKNSILNPNALLYQIGISERDFIELCGIQEQDMPAFAGFEINEDKQGAESRILKLFQPR